MISTHSHNTLTWINAISPTKEEILNLKERYSLPALVADELFSPTPRSKVDRYKDVLYLILHFPITGSSGRVQKEIDFVIGKDFIITAHYEEMSILSQSASLFTDGTFLGKEQSPTHTGFVFFHLMHELYRQVLLELDTVNDSLGLIEDQIFDGKERKMVEVISDTNRVIVDFKQALRFHGEVLKSFESAGVDFFGKEFTFHLRGIIGEYNKIQNALDGHKEILRDLRETNDSLLSNKTNEAMRILTVLSFIILPLTLIAGIFGMNATFMFISSLSDFFAIVAGMLGGAISMLLFFRKKKWI
ncbi:MAG: magnesium transporter CorA family protein [Candidatus Pacebacteria bacterium]|nr:magnesium transporter CorA family protein [Candidatus Paceibacterota bacterium]